MASSTAPFFILETTPLSSRIIRVEKGQITAAGNFAPDRQSALADFVAKHGGASTGILLASPEQSKLVLSPANQTAIRGRAAWEAFAAKTAPGFAVPLKLHLCDAQSGTAPADSGNAPWLMSIAPSADYAAGRTLLSDSGLKADSVHPALLTQIGAAVQSLKLGGEPDELVLISVGQQTSTLVRLSAAGVQAVAESDAGIETLFEAVQAGLGLKFKAAAAKLFFNDAYDFSDTAEAIAQKFSESLQPALTALGGQPAKCWLPGLLKPQQWLGVSLAKALGLTPFVIDTARLAQAGKLSLGGSPEIAPSLIASAAARSTESPAWLPNALDEASPAPVASAPPKATTPEAAPSAAKVSPAPSAAPSTAAVTPPASTPPVVSAPKAKAATPPPAPLPSPTPPPAKPAPSPAQTPAAAPAATAKQAPHAEPHTPKTTHPAHTPPSDTAAAPRKKKSPLGLIIGALVAILVLAGGFVFYSQHQKAKAEAERVAAEKAAKEAEIARLREIKLSALQAEINRDPKSFKNSNYSFQVSPKGFLSKLTNASNQLLIDSAGAVNLQGSYTAPGGRKVWFYAGGVGNSTYTASVEKGIVGADIAFSIKVTHPRFEMKQVITCLEKSIKVDVDFTPVKLQDERGSVNAIYTLQLWPAAINAREATQIIKDAVRYPTQAGPLRISYGGDVWQVGEKEGRQLVTVGDTSTAFYFTDTNDPARRKLSYEIFIP